MSGPRGGAPQEHGEVIADRYTVERRIAKGGMATVYLARQVKVNRLVALKVFTPPVDEEVARDFENRFLLEGETLASLDHPNIVTLYDFGELPGNRFYLAMEYVEGPRFTDLVKNGPLDPDQAIRLLLQVCSALRYAHMRGVVHRDLKPGNLLVRANENGVDQIKVVDFGLVKLVADDQNITRAGMILGSPHCMAPEQVNGLDLDHRADIYAVGVLLFRSIVGAYPFHGSSSAATMIAHLQQPTPTFASLNPDVTVPDGLEDVVRRCLEKSPSNRYPNMDGLITDLTFILAGVRADEEGSASVSSSTLRAPISTWAPEPDYSPSWRTQAAAIVLAGLMLLLSGVLVTGAGIAIGVWAVRQVPPPPTAPAPVQAPAPAPPPAPEVQAPAPAPAPPEEAVDPIDEVPAPAPAPAPTPRAPQPERPLTPR